MKKHSFGISAAMSFHSTQDGEDNAIEKYLLSEGEVALQEAEKDGK
jgi:hypothetical protein